jgi:hypothetical protein
MNREDTEEMQQGCSIHMTHCFEAYVQNGEVSNQNFLDFLCKVQFCI